MSQMHYVEYDAVHISQFNIVSIHATKRVLIQLIDGEQLLRKALLCTFNPFHFSPVSANIEHSWVSPIDIADVADALINHIPAGKSTKFVVSDWVTGNDWLKALAGNGIEAKYQQIPIEALVENMIKLSFHEDTANRFAQMSRAGESPDEFYASLRATDYHLGKVKLEDFAKMPLDILQESGPARVITVSGNPGFFKNPVINFDDIQMERQYNGMSAANQSLFAKTLFAFE